MLKENQRSWTAGIRKKLESSSSSDTTAPGDDLYSNILELYNTTASIIQHTGLHTLHTGWMKGDLVGAGCCGGLWLSGYVGFSQTPWVQVPRLPVFLFSSSFFSRLNSNNRFISSSIRQYLWALQSNSLSNPTYSNRTCVHCRNCLFSHKRKFD